MRALGAIVRTRKRILLLAALAVALGGLFVVWISRPTLDEFVGRDLRKLAEEPQPKWKEWLSQVVPEKYISSKSRLHRLLDGILPKEYAESRDPFFGFQPWHLWKHVTADESIFILCDVRQLSIIPGSACAAIHFLDSRGTHLGWSEIYTGNRCDLNDVTFGYEELAACPVIKIRTSASIGGADTLQVYGIIERRIAMLRLARRDGKLWQMSYHPRPWAGPAPPTRSVAEWEQVLRSADVPCILEALTWIGGDHNTSWDKEHESNRLVKAVRARRLVRARITTLAESDNPWIREAAIEAQQQLKLKK